MITVAMVMIWSCHMIIQLSESVASDGRGPTVLTHYAAAGAGHTVVAAAFQPPSLRLRVRVTVKLTRSD
jgi:hypothetical protein